MKISHMLNNFTGYLLGIFLNLVGRSQVSPDVYFQARETVNSYYLACPDITQKAMDEFAACSRTFRCAFYGCECS